MIEEQGAEVALGSVTQSDLVDELVNGVATVFHLAATQHEMNVPDQHFHDVNVAGTRRMLEASVRAGVRRFVHGSTIGVYGSAAGIIDENTPCEPDNIYGETKLEGELVVASFLDRLPAVIIRIPEVYGPGDRRLLKLFKAVGRGGFFMIGRGDNLHHPAYIDDILDGLLAAAESPNALGEVLLLAGKEPVTTNDMVADIARALGRTPPRFRAPMLPFTVTATLLEVTMRPLGLQPPLHRRRLDFFRKSFTLSAEKATRLVGYSPKVSFGQGAKDTAGWYKSMGYL